MSTNSPFVKTDYQIPKHIIDYTKEKQKNVTRTICFVKSDGSLSLMPSAQRGNSTYAFDRSERYVEIAYCLNTMLRCKYDNKTLVKTNQFFVTLTASYDYEIAGESWDKVAKAYNLFAKKLKYYYKIKGSLVVKEAHLKGGLHLHCLFSFGNDFNVEKRIKLMTNKEDRTKVHPVTVYENDTLTDLINSLWSDAIGSKSLVSCQGINDSVEMYDYLYKEFAKCGSISNSLRFYGTSKFNDLDKHRILTFYYSTVNGCKRIIQASNSLRYEKCGGFPLADPSKVNKIALHVLGGMFDFDRVIEKYGRERLDTEIRNNLQKDENGRYNKYDIADLVSKLVKLPDFKNPVVATLLGEYIIDTKDSNKSLFAVNSDGSYRYKVYNVDDVNCSSVKEKVTTIFIFSVSRYFKNDLKYYGENKHLSNDCSERNILLATLYKSIENCNIYTDYTNYAESFRTTLGKNSVDEFRKMAHGSAYLVQFVADESFNMIKRAYDERLKNGYLSALCSGKTFRSLYKGVDDK